MIHTYIRGKLLVPNLSKSKTKILCQLMALIHYYIDYQLRAKSNKLYKYVITLFLIHTYQIGSAFCRDLARAGITLRR